MADKNHDAGATVRLAATLARGRYEVDGGTMIDNVHPDTIVDMSLAAKRESDGLHAEVERLTRELAEAQKQSRLAWERAAEKDRAYGDMIAERDAARQERDLARVELVQRGMEIDALKDEKKSAVEAFHDATRLRSCIQEARVKAEDERDALRAMMPSEEVVSVLRNLVRRETGGVAVPHAPYDRVEDALDRLSPPSATAHGGENG